MSEKLNVVMEVGVFDEMDIDDPTKVKVDKKDDEIEDLIQDAIKANSNLGELVK